MSDINADTLRVRNELIALGADETEDECPICNSYYGPSHLGPWHWPLDDCRAVQQPVDPNESIHQG